MNDETTMTGKYDDLSQKKEHRKKRHKLLITERLLDFSKNTTLHGLRYVTQIGLSTVEKMFWLLMFVISVVLCSLLIMQVWFKWCDSPIIVTITERMIPVEDVSFPSVTICPQMKNKVKKYEYAKQFSKYERHLGGYDGPLNDTVESELKMLDDAMLVCDSYREYRHVLKSNITNASTILNIIKIAPTLQETISSVIHWRGEFYLNSRMLSKVLTREGVCFTFNTVQQKDMFKNESVQNQYLYIHPPEFVEEDFTPLLGPRENFKEYPRRGRESGPTPDLAVMLKQDVTDNDGLCNYHYKGYKAEAQFISFMRKYKVCSIDWASNLVGVEALEHKDLKASMGDACNCLPSCNSVEYDADIIKTNFDWKNHNFSRLEVYFKEPRYVSMRRSELFGLTDFLANCGGLLGLFLGFSFLSIIEIFYFCTLRLWYALKRDKGQKKISGKLRIKAKKQRKELKKY